MHKLPTIVQAGIVDEKKPNDLDRRFEYRIDKKTDIGIKGKSGWLPIKAISDAAYDLGFVDGNRQSPQMVPLLEKYKNAYVKSLLFSVLLYCYPQVVVKWNESIQVDGKIIKLNNKNEFAVNIKDARSIQYISFVDLLNGECRKKGH